MRQAKIYRKETLAGKRNQAVDCKYDERSPCMGGTDKQFVPQQRYERSILGTYRQKN